MCTRLSNRALLPFAGSQRRVRLQGIESDGPDDGGRRQHEHDAEDDGGVPEVVEHGETGYLAHVGDIDEMSRSAIDILSDESRLRAMGQRARKVAEEKFSASKIIPLYEGFYREMIAAG